MYYYSNFAKNKVWNPGRLIHPIGFKCSYANDGVDCYMRFSIYIFGMWVIVFLYGKKNV